MSIEQIKITEQISYIKSSDNPLSADVSLVDGQEYLYVFDVGNNEKVAEYLNAIPKKKRVILSHFHTDHMGTLAGWIGKAYILGQIRRNTFSIIFRITQRSGLRSCRRC